MNTKNGPKIPAMKLITATILAVSMKKTMETTPPTDIKILVQRTLSLKLFVATKLTVALELVMAMKLTGHPHCFEQ